MKKIVCELCECMEFTKEGGMFICQGCGTKYTAEEARGMMREVEGAGPAVTGGAPAAVPMGNPNQQQVDNLLLLATNAFSASNNEETENYCNRAIELDATCYKAWFLKAKAIGWSSKLDNNRMEEAAHSFCQAIDFAPEEEKDDLKNQAVEELKKLGLAFISLRKENFGNSPSTSNYNGFKNDRLVLIKSLTVLLQHGNIVGMPEGYLDQVATMMNEAAVAALNMARNAWKNVEHPSEKDLVTYLDWNVNICALLKDSISASDADEESDIVRYKNLNIALEDPIGKSSYKREWVSYASEYRWFTDKCLADDAVANRKKEVQRNKDAIAKIEKSIRDKKEAERKKAEEAKKARIAAYWEAHADEKAKLDAEKKELTDKKSKMSAEIADLDKQIKAAQPTGNVPSEDERNKVKAQIKELENQRAGLGIFAGKEKKRIGEEIASLQGRVDSLKSKIEEEKKTRTAEADKKIAPLKAKKDELEKQVSAATKSLSAIEAELTKDPEA